MCVSANEISNVSSNNIILYNLNDNKVIYEKNADDKVNIASLTKIMTAIIAIENISDYEKKILVTSDMLSNLADDLSKVGFKPGEIVTYNDLLYGTLLKSGADATNILAISISGSIGNFVNLMNEKAKSLGMINSSFSNTIGIEGKNHYSTARDISLLLIYALKNEKFKEIFTRERYISSNLKHDIGGPLNRIRENSELNMDYIMGAKTGYTSKAGLCLASIATYNDINYLLITIGADYKNKMQNIEDSKNIYEYFFNNYEYKTILSKDDKLVSLKTIYGKKYNVLSDENVDVYLKKSITKSDLSYEYIGKDVLDKSISKGDKVGIFYIKYKGEVLYEKTIVSKDDVKINLLYLIKNNIFLISIILVFIILLIVTLRIRKK